MRYIPHTHEDVAEMLGRLGLSRLEDLFAGIPASARCRSALEVPPPLAEEELRGAFEELEAANAGHPGLLHFLGAGAYDHAVPAVIGHLLSRSELYSAYTPYQPEISQGTLQAMFEFQTMICQLTGLEVANASMYDGASSAAEAALMCVRISRNRRVLVADSVHPQVREVMRTYCRHGGIELDGVAVGEDGTVDLGALAAAREAWGAETACLVVQSPNFLGCVEPLVQVREAFPPEAGLLVQVVGDPLSLGILRSPGEQGADVAVGDVQGFGLPLQYGGPYGGFFATRQRFVRNMPGRVVGETLDHDGRRGFVLTLSTREQHIRRSRATSNICTNHSLCALASTIYLALLGKSGLRDLAVTNLSKAEYAKSRLRGIPGVRLRFAAPTFNEFVVELPRQAGEILHRVRDAAGLVAGLPLGVWLPDLERCLLVCVTERRKREQIDRLAEALEEACPSR